MENQVSEKRVREIAREELEKEIGSISDELVNVKTTLQLQGEILARLERLLLGEEGMESEDTLKQRANFAFIYARRRTEEQFVERTKPVLEWYEGMTRCPEGEKESKMATLKRIITWFLRIEWLLAIIGITTLANLVFAVKYIIDMLS